MEENVYLMDPLPYGGNVLPFVIATGNNWNFRILCGIFDFREKNTPRLKQNKFKYTYSNHSVLDKAFSSKEEPLSLHYAKFNLYNLIEDNYKGLLKPLDKITLTKTNILGLLVFVSACLPKRDPIWNEFYYLTLTMNSDSHSLVELFIDDGGNYWRIEELK